MKRTPVLAGSLLAGIVFLLYASTTPLVAADVRFSESLEKVLAFHDHFKDPSTMSNRQGTLLPPERFANTPRLPRDSAWQMGGLIAVECNGSRELAYNGLIEPTTHSFNSLSIGVSKITVIAINMGKGGNAVATSDIVLSPIQYLEISSGSEVEEKLK